MAGGESKVARLQETPTKKSRKRKPSKASSGLFKARTTEPFEEVEPESEVPDEVQDIPVPSQGDPAPNSAEGESSQAPSEAPPVAAPQDAYVLMFGLLQQMTNLVGILTTQLKPNEAAALDSIGVKVVKKVPKAFEGDRDYERVWTWLREVENFFRAMAVEENQKMQTAAGLLGGDALTWWAEYIKDQEIVESEMSWTKFKALVTSRFTPEYANIRTRVAWLDLRQTHSIKAYVGKFQGIVSTLQHVLDYDKQLKFIHGLQPWARKLIFQIPQLPDNLHDLMRMAERLEMTRWTRRSLAAR